MPKGCASSSIWRNGVPIPCSCRARNEAIAGVWSPVESPSWSLQRPRGARSHSASPALRPYELVRASDQERTAPGAETLRALLGGQPTLILLDELSVYLRKVKGKRDAEQLTPSGAFVMTRGRLGHSLVRPGLTLVHEADLDCALLVRIEFAEVDVELMTALPRNTSHAAQDW